MWLLRSCQSDKITRWALGHFWLFREPTRIKITRIAVVTIIGCKAVSQCVVPVCDQYVFAQGYWGCAIGKAKQAAKTEIEKLQVRHRIRINTHQPRWWSVGMGLFSEARVCLCVFQMKDMTCRELVKEVAKMWVCSFKWSWLTVVCDPQVGVRHPHIQVDLSVLKGQNVLALVNIYDLSKPLLAIEKQIYKYKHEKKINIW